MLGDVAGGSGALVGIVEADLIDIILAFGDLDGGGGRSQHKDAILVGLSGNGDRGGGGGRAYEDLHAPVEEVVVGIDGFFGVVFIVLRLDLDLDAALGVDLLGSQLGAVFRGVAVLCVVAGQRADGADLQSGAALSTGVLSAASEKAHHKRECENHTKYLFHFPFLLSEC